MSALRNANLKMFVSFEDWSRKLFLVFISFRFTAIKVKKHNSDQYYGKRLCWKKGKTVSRAIFLNKQKNNNNPNKLVHPFLNKADFLALLQ